MFVALGVIAFLRWRERGGVTRAWMAATFGDLAVVLVIAGVPPPPAEPGLAQVITSLLVLGIGPLFLLGFAPPRIVLAAWRRPEELQLRQAESGLMAALTPAEVAQVLLPHVA